MYRKAIALFIAILLLTAISAGAVQSEPTVLIPLNQSGSVSVATEHGTVTFDTTAMAYLNAQADDGQLKVALVPAAARARPQGSSDRPIYTLSITQPNGTPITDFGGGHAVLQLPYSLQEGEYPDYICAVSVDTSEKIRPVTCSAWENGTMGLLVDCPGTYGIFRRAVMFQDTSRHWSVGSVSFAASRGIVVGMTETAFEPDRATSWAMAVTVLGRMAGVPDADASEQWYAPYWAWAQKNKLLPAEAAPEAVISRQSLAGLLTGYLVAQGYGPSHDWEPSLHYTDRNEIDPCSWHAVAYATSKGLLQGRETGKFDPCTGLTRAELSAVIQRLIIMQLTR